MTKHITFDKYGRMRYHPDYHPNHKKPITTIDRKFIIENYEAMGAELISLAIGRTIKSVYAYVTLLRKQGLMPRAENHKKHKREIRPTKV